MLYIIFVVMIRCYNNAFYARVGGISTREINFLEVDLLFGLGFHLNVTPNTFHTYCSCLQKEMMLLQKPPLVLNNNNNNISLIITSSSENKSHLIFEEDEASHHQNQQQQALVATWKKKKNPCNYFNYFQILCKTHYSFGAYILYIDPNFYFFTFFFWVGVRELYDWGYIYYWRNPFDLKEIRRCEYFKNMMIN